jgi:hypothetical protein
MKNISPNQHKTLATKIAKVEIVIILILIFVWLSVFYLMNTKQKEYIGKMTSLQEKILLLTNETLTPYNTAEKISWPLKDVFSYLVIAENTIIDSDIDRLRGKNLTIKQAFGNFSHAQEMMKQLRLSKDGTDWIKLDKMAPKQWISWSTIPQSPYIVALISSEDNLMDISGYKGYRFMLLICACLVSALLLLFLIWALSWIRISAVKALMENS